MIPYLIIFFITAFIAFRQIDKPKVSKKIFFGYCFCLGCFVGLSDMLGGYDRYIYGEVFQSIAINVHEGYGVFNDTFLRFFGTEPIYGLINTIIGLFTPNRYVFIFIFTILIYTLLPIAMYRYTKNPFFSLLLFLGLMFFFSFTYLRQVMACGICWLAIPYVVDRKFWKFAGLVVIASLIHNSAAYFLLLYFIPIKKYSEKNIVIFMFLLFFLGLSGISKYIFLISSDFLENEKIARYAIWAEYGFKIDYVIEALLFLVILLHNYSKVKTDRHSLVVSNIYLMFCGILLFFCKSSDGGRISWYCSIGIMIVVSNLCQLKSSVNLRSLVGILSFGLYFRILWSWGNGGILYPYKTFLTTGHTGAEWVYEKYEYDFNYDEDKMYNLMDFFNEK